MTVRRNSSSQTRAAGERSKGERIGPKRREPHARVASRPETVLDAPAGDNEDAQSLETIIEQRLEAYVAALKGHLPRDLYGLIMPQLERPLIRVAMSLAEGRQSVAAAMLGIHRNTLRARLKELGLEADYSPKPRR